MSEEKYMPVLDKDAIPLHVWETLGEETAIFIRRLLRDPDIRAELMAKIKDGDNNGASRR